MKRILLSLLMGLVVVCEGADSEAKLRADLKASLEKLDGMRKKIGEEKPKLSKAVAERELELVELRRKVRLARMEADARVADLKDLRRKHAVLEKDAAYLESVLKDFDSEADADLIKGSAVWGRGMDLLEEQLGGRRYSGEAVTNEGDVVKGEFVEVGPGLWFKGDGVRGAVMKEAGRELGTVFEADGVAVDGLFAGEEVTMDVDVTGGKARLIGEVQGDSFFKLLEKGGVWLYPILLVALISVVCAILKLIQLLKVHRPRGGWLSEILDALRRGDEAEAERLARGVQHPAGNLLGDAIGYVGAGAEVVEEVVYERLIDVQSRLQKWLSFIAVTAATAPLLGLLGTVSGMIRMFNVITVTGTGDVKPMAGGISEALVTTLFGLVVAIPALILHAMLSRRSNGVTQESEKFGLSLVNGLRNMEKGK